MSKMAEWWRGTGDWDNFSETIGFGFRWFTKRFFFINYIVLERVAWPVKILWKIK
jgi:hypothetical protein